MIRYLKDISSGLFILIVAFSYSIFFIIATLLGFPQDGIIFRLYSGFLALIAFSVFLLSSRRIPGKVFVNSIFLCVIVVLLYFSTRILYLNTNSVYTSYFLSMGVRFIPAILIGVYMLSVEDILERVEKALLPFILIYTLTLASVTFTAKIGVNLNQTFNTGMLTYQSISYYAIFAYGFTIYLISNNWKTNSNVLRYFLVFLAIIQVLITIMAGGRGAFVLGCVFTAYYAMKHMSFSKLFVYFVVAFAALFFVESLLSNNAIFKMGFNRIFDFFGNSDSIENDLRWVRWGLAWNAFIESPLFGHGLGSVFYEVGFYSHNIITDMLCEGGILLALLFTYILFRFVKSSLFLINEDKRYEIFVVIFLCSFILSCFSGYYLSDTGLWLSIAFILNKVSIVKYSKL